MGKAERAERYPRALLHGSDGHGAPLLAAEAQDGCTQLLGGSWRWCGAEHPSGTPVTFLVGTGDGSGSHEGMCRIYSLSLKSDPNSRAAAHSLPESYPM